MHYRFHQSCAAAALLWLFVTCDACVPLPRLSPSPSPDPRVAHHPRLPTCTFLRYSPMRMLKAARASAVSRAICICLRKARSSSWRCGGRQAGRQAGGPVGFARAQRRQGEKSNARR